MEGQRHPARLAVTEAREQVLEQLSDAFAQDQLGLEEFEGSKSSRRASTARTRPRPSLGCARWFKTWRLRRQHHGASWPW
jgi:hypothetical protein